MYSFPTLAPPRRMSWLAPALTCSLLAFVAGCSGGSSGGSILGLSVAEQMSVVTVDEDDIPVVIAPATEGDAPTFPAGADYNTDTSSSHVYDSSMETLSTVNEILCMLTQTAYADMVNLGVYNAQIDEAKCQQGSSSGSSSSETGQSSGTQAEAPSIWIVDSSRASSDSDQIVDFWVTQQADDSKPAGAIWGHMVISEGSSSDNPFGVFELNFAMVPTGLAIDDAVFTGTLRTLDVLDGFMGFSFFMSKGDLNVVHAPNEHSQIVQANVNMFADQTQGVAYIAKQERANFPPGGDTGITSQSYRIAFDLNNMLRAKDSDPSVCLSRTTFDTRVWRYNLYYADGDNAGARVERNSGFGFQTEGGDYGWIGYYGMWVPPGVTLESGDTVTRHVFGDDAATPYTVIKSPGKLIKNTRNTLALAELDGESFEWWDYGTPGVPPSGPPANYRVEYASPFFVKVAIFDDASHSFIDLSSPEIIDTAAYGFLGMWSQSLGGSVSYIDGDDSITYYAQEFINGSSDLFGVLDAVDLYGYRECLDAGLTGAEAEAGTVYLPASMDVMAPYHYVFSKADLTLYYDTDGLGTLVAAGLAPGEAPTSGPFSWGMRSGPMVPSTAGFVDVNDVWAQDVFYVYETGHNPWNQYAALVDALNVAVSFDPPLQFTYTHATASDVNGDATFDGKKYFLNYNGPGDLFGIPHEEIDTDGDGMPDRFYPVFSILDGVLMGPNDIEYVIRGIEREMTLSEDVGACGALSIDTVDQLPLPSASDYTPPDIGPPPIVDEAPQVIEGALQE